MVKPLCRPYNSLHYGALVNMLQGEQSANKHSGALPTAEHRGGPAISSHAKADRTKPASSPRAHSPILPTAQRGPMLADAREVMNIRQASHYLGVSPDTLYKYVSEEMIPAFKLGNRWKFKKSVLDNWMENQSFHSEPFRPRKLSRPAPAMAAAD
jgi:excisionase family DNA binding protein